MGKVRAVTVELMLGCYCWVRIGMLGLNQGRAVTVGQA